VWGNYDLALRYFNQTLAIRPLYADAKYHRGMVELNHRDFEHGWLITNFARRSFRSPRSGTTGRAGKASRSPEKTILLHCEQGLGIRCNTFAMPAGEKSRATVLCEVQKPLMRLLSLTPGIDALLEEGDPSRRTIFKSAAQRGCLLGFRQINRRICLRRKSGSRSGSQNRQIPGFRSASPGRASRASNTTGSVDPAGPIRSAGAPERPFAHQPAKATAWTNRRQSTDGPRH